MKNFKGMEHLSDAEAEKVLTGIKTLSTLLIEFLKENQETDNSSNELKEAA